jgi:hypothetical protein
MRARAAEMGRAIDLREGDAQNLPFEDTGLLGHVRWLTSAAGGDAAARLCG